MPVVEVVAGNWRLGTLEARRYSEGRVERLKRRLPVILSQAMLWVFLTNNFGSREKERLDSYLFSCRR